MTKGISDILVTSKHVFLIRLTRIQALTNGVKHFSSPAIFPSNNAAVRPTNNASLIPFSLLSSENTSVRGRSPYLYIPERTQ